LTISLERLHAEDGELGGRDDTGAKIAATVSIEKTSRLSDAQRLRGANAQGSTAGLK
jgi:hypothetical protein